MPKIIKKGSSKRGLPPGSLVHIGEKTTDKITITIIDYDADHFEEHSCETVEDCFAFKHSKTVTWINIDGIHDVSLIEKLGKHYDIHPLVLEDILHTGQRPKLEDFESYLYIVLKMLHQTGQQIDAEQVSLILGDNVVISFQEKKGDVFDIIRDRIRTGKGRIRKMKADYLAYCLLDAIVDNYFLILERFSDHLEELEDIVLADPTPETLQAIQRVKRDLIFLRKSIWPLREVISVLHRTESRLIQKGTGIFLRDVYDHTIQVIDSIESFRDVNSGMFDIYMSSVSNRMNEIMKVLTIFAAIFIPLTFIAGIYGMNFQYMPELAWKEGYFGVLALMLLVGVTLVVYFRRKKWL